MRNILRRTSLPLYIFLILDQLHCCKKLLILVNLLHQSLCELDPIPTSIILKHVEIIAPIIQEIINLSITTGIMPENMKEPILWPLLKKLNLDLQQFKNFRPVSNLFYISKLVQCAVCNQLMEYAGKNWKLRSIAISLQSGPLHWNCTIEG